MTRFRWNNAGSEKAVIALAHLWARNRGMSVEEAIHRTIPLHSKNPEAIPQRVVNGLRREVEQQMKGAVRNECGRKRASS